MKIKIRIAIEDDIDFLVQFAKQLYNSGEDLHEDFHNLLKDDDAVVFLAYDQNKNVIGFAHVEIRHDYVEGCKTNNVGYLEGIFLQPEYRSFGVGKMLVEKAIKWAKEKGCTEFASDCEVSNDISVKFHESVGFHEVNRIVCFKMDI